MNCVEPVATAVSEVRRFKMHPKLLMDVIRRQAGTLSKAILEGVQNSIDARSTGVDVSIERTRVVISDDGRGFPSRDEIERFFEVFGQPHDAGEGKVFGTFRMGRGQLFAFGRNSWRSGEFSMRVDIERSGLDYQLGSGLEPVSGCTVEIDLYEPLDPLQLHELERSVSRLVKYAEVPVRVNGTQVSKPASGQKWKHSTDDAWFNITPGGSGGIEVFNLGVFVAELSSYEHGCSGVIVTRKQVKVNFARNDIMATCPVWKRVLPVLRELSGKESLIPQRLTPSQRASVWRDVVAKGWDLTGYEEHKLFVDSNGDAHSLRQLFRRMAQFGGKYSYGSGKARMCFAPHGSALADRIMQAELGLVLDSTMIETGGCHEAAEFVSVVQWRPYAGKVERLSDRFELAEVETVAKPLADRGHSVLDPNELSPIEGLGLQTADAIAELVCDLAVEQEMGAVSDWSVADRTTFYDKKQSMRRRVRAGESDSADGWTDGSSYIAVRKSFLSAIGTESSFTDLTLLIMHEYCHRTNSIGDHTHDFEFYRAYHELSRKAGVVAGKAKAYFEQRLVSAGRRVTARKKREARRELLAEARTQLGIPAQLPGMPSSTEAVGEAAA